MFMMTYHSVLCHQARDLFSAGSAAGVGGNGRVKSTKVDALIADQSFDGLYMLRALSLLEDDIRKAAVYLEDALFLEYWGDSVKLKIDIHDPMQRIKYWLQQADLHAKTWKPSDYLFQDLQ